MVKITTGLAEGPSIDIQKYVSRLSKTLLVRGGRMGDSNKKKMKKKKNAEKYEC